MYIFAFCPIDIQIPAKFHEIPSMVLQDIKETKRYGRTPGRTDTRTDGRENSILPLKLRFGGGYKYQGPNQGLGDLESHLIHFNIED